MPDQLRFLLDHPYFRHDGGWHAQGWYIEEQGALLTAGGDVRLHRRDDDWMVVSDLRIALIGQPDMVFHNAYSFEPPDEDSREVFWTNASPFAGEMAGRFTVIADAVLSLGFSEDGRHTLSETLMLTDDGTYEARGTLSREGETVGAWALTLEPMEAVEPEDDAA